MALIVRIDVDRPYGKHPGYRHVLSRLSSDLYFPRIESCGYLDELKWMLRTQAAEKTSPLTGELRFSHFEAGKEGEMLMFAHTSSFSEHQRAPER